MLDFGQEKLNQYKKYVAERLMAATPILQKVARGDFTEKIQFPEEKDEFTELLVGLQSMTEALRELEKTREEKEKAQTTLVKAEKKKRVIAEKIIKKLQIEIEQKAQKIKETNELRERFIADASHELRTPLSVLQTNLDLLSSLREFTPPFFKDFKDSIESSKNQVNHLTIILEELSLLSRGKKLEELRETVKINLTLRETAEELRALAEAKDINYQIRISDQDLEVMGDEAMLRKLVRNLISNAIKYERMGGNVIITLRRGEGEEAEFLVKDSGLGISKRELPRIFERFYRVDRGRSKERGGVGLGLAICKWITELHGGEIKAESKYGKGSTFKVSLPLRGSLGARRDFWGYKARKRLEDKI